jgi:hypothetical protein
MMKVKRWLWIILSVLVMLSMIAAAPAAKKVVYIKAGASKDVQVGNAGARVDNSYFTGHMIVSRRSTEPVTGTDRLRPYGKMLDVRFRDLDGNFITHITGTWYVFFTLSPKEMKLFNDRKISIFYYDPWPKKWKECYTWKTNTPNRVACRVVNFGLYGVGNRYR